MRTMLCALVLLSTLPPTLQAKGPSSSAVKKLIAEMLQPDCSKQRWTEIRQLLGQANPKYLKAPLVSAINKQETSSRALDAAIALRARGLFSSVKRLIEEEEQKVVRLLMLTQDRGATAFLFARWKKMDEASDSFKLLSEAFSKSPVDTRTVFRFSAYLLKQEKAAAAAKILRFQMNLSTDQPKEIAASWRQLQRAHTIATTPFRIKGIDLLTEKAQITKGRKLGGNVRLQKDGMLVIEDFPGWINSCEIYTLTLRVFLPAKEKASVRFSNSKGTGFALQIAGDKWYVKISDEVEREAVLKEGDWNEFVYKIERLRKPPEGRPALARSNNCWINKILMLDRAWFDEKVGKLVVFCGQEQGLVVGGVDLVRVR